jgi:hypothetical protein
MSRSLRQLVAVFVIVICVVLLCSGSDGSKVKQSNATTSNATAKVQKSRGAAESRGATGKRSQEA